MWDLIVTVPDHCLSFYFSNCMDFFLKCVNVAFSAVLAVGDEDAEN